VLPSVFTVTDLGVCYDRHFSFRPHINHIVAKASLRAKLILKCLVTCDPKLLSKAFSVFVRPILEFSSVVWSPYFNIDIKKIESVQKWFTKACMPKFTYNDRLSVLGLQTLETRRIMSDNTCYKILNNNIDVDLNSLFTFSHNTHTRGNSKKLAVCRTTIALLTAGTSYQTMLSWLPALPVLRLIYLSF